MSDDKKITKLEERTAKLEERIKSLEETQNASRSKLASHIKTLSTRIESVETKVNQTKAGKGTKAAGATSTKNTYQWWCFYFKKDFIGFSKKVKRWDLVKESDLKKLTEKLDISKISDPQKFKVAKGTWEELDASTKGKWKAILQSFEKQQESDPDLSIINFKYSPVKDDAPSVKMNGAWYDDSDDSDDTAVVKKEDVKSKGSNNDFEVEDSSDDEKTSKSNTSSSSSSESEDNKKGKGKGKGKK